MAARSLKDRVEVLEQKVEDLQVLPARVAAVEEQILQLRGEMHDGFSAIDHRFEAIDRRFEAIDLRFEAIDRRFDGLDERIEETQRYMRVLHEEVLARLSLLQEDRRRE